jgi:hypothetical protein
VVGGMYTYTTPWSTVISTKNVKISMRHRFFDWEKYIQDVLENCWSHISLKIYFGSKNNKWFLLSYWEKSLSDKIQNKISIKFSVYKKNVFRCQFELFQEKCFIYRKGHF